MANVRIPIVDISATDSYPLGKANVIEIDAITDGTAKIGFACEADTTEPNEVKIATVGDELGIVACGPGDTLGDTPAAGTKVKVCVFGPVVASVTAGADNFMQGKPLCAHATTGTMIPPVATAGSATSTSATLLDWRASDGVGYHVIMFKGLSLNSNTHS
jgi:hypothetical protein